MKSNPNASELARACGLSVEGVRARIRALNFDLGRSKRYTLEEVCKVAAYRGDGRASDISAERLRKTKNEADLLAAKVAEMEGRLIPVGEVEILINEYGTPIREAWLTLPKTMATRCNPTDPEIAEKALSEWVAGALRLVDSQFLKSHQIDGKT